MTDRVRHDEKAGDEIDANYQGPYERDPVGFDTVRRGLSPSAFAQIRHNFIDPILLDCS